MTRKPGMKVKSDDDDDAAAAGVVVATQSQDSPRHRSLPQQEGSPGARPTSAPYQE